MSYNVFVPDRELIELISLLDGVNEEVQRRAINAGLLLLEGTNISNEMQSIAGSFPALKGKIEHIFSGLATLLWECSKSASKYQQQSVLNDLLVNVGVSAPLSAVFCQTFHDSKRRLMALRGSLGVNAFSYQNLAWRLEVELSKRNMSMTSEPRYLLRLDLANNAAAPVEKDSTDFSSSIDNRPEKMRSHHLQADHANMKLLEQELQRALDEVGGVHCQRIARYLS